MRIKSGQRVRLSKTYYKWCLHNISLYRVSGKIPKCHYEEIIKAVEVYFDKAPGACGTVISITAEGDAHVKWDDAKTYEWVDPSCLIKIKRCNHCGKETK